MVRNIRFMAEIHVSHISCFTPTKTIWKYIIHFIKSACHDVAQALVHSFIVFTPCAVSLQSFAEQQTSKRNHTCFLVWVQHSCTVRPKDVVPVGEVGGVVATVTSVVGLVMGSATQTGQQSMQSPRQVVAAVVFHGQPAVEDVEDDFAQRVTAQHPGAAQGQQQQGQQLGWAGVLGCQSKGHVVLVVQLVDAAVEPGNPGRNKQLSLFILLLR